MGNITAIADNLDSAYNRTFAYDDLHRLITANTGIALWGSGSYTYDRMGNMLTGRSNTFAYQGTTPLLNTATGLTGSMAYDDAGNELSSPAGQPGGIAGPAAIYSPRNLLSSQFVRRYDRCFEELGSACIQPDFVNVWLDHVYDGRGVRVMSIDRVVAEGEVVGIEEPPPPAYYFYTPELSMLNIVSRTTARTADVIWFGSHPIADHGDSGLRYTLTDHLGTPILQTNTSASIVWHARTRPPSAPSTNSAPATPKTTNPSASPANKSPSPRPPAKRTTTSSAGIAAGGGAIRKVIRLD